MIICMQDTTTSLYHEVGVSTVNSNVPLYRFVDEGEQGFLLMAFDDFTNDVPITIFVVPTACATDRGEWGEKHQGGASVSGPRHKTEFKTTL